MVDHYLLLFNVSPTVEVEVVVGFSGGGDDFKKGKSMLSTCSYDYKYALFKKKILAPTLTVQWVDARLYLKEK